MPKNPRSYEKTRHIALSGLLFALAMALSFIEGSLVIPGLLPGMKLGLANIVVMYALFFMGVKQALVLDVLKALFVFLVSGFTAGFLSLCGGLLSLLVMAVLYIGGDNAMVSANLPIAAVRVFQGSLLLAYLVAVTFVRYRLEWRRAGARSPA